MLVNYTEETDIGRIYQPQSSSDCNNIDCNDCIFRKYLLKAADCPFCECFADFLITRKNDTIPKHFS